MKKIYQTWIKGYEGMYMITSDGEVVSLPRLQKGRYNNYSRNKGRVLTKRKNRGYWSVALSKDKSYRRFSIHRLVYQSFVGEIPKGKQINHIDGDKLNNKLKNLEVVTPKENTQHAWRNGLSKKQMGEKNGLSRLKEWQVLEIKRLGHRVSQKELAKMFDCHQTSIHYILSGKTWSHVKA